MPDQVYLTPEGKAELQQELDELLNVRRPELASKLKEAVSQGDLKENADYHDAKEKQAFMEGRIQYLENVLRSAVLISNDGKVDEVRMGSEVTIVEEGGDEEEVYKIVGAAEANPRENKISHESPIGSAMLGHRKGDKVRVKTPSGELIFKIKRIK
ncbi:MAG TPA: transcription elongation factor GreA [Phototrophicaceae bacterium]|nr:transcription elongation factor GreA [Phototrophicaceae bacterium]